MGAFAGALASALSDEARCFPAVLTLAVTLPACPLFGIGSAFWGLVAGLSAGLDRIAARAR